MGILFYIWLTCTIINIIYCYSSIKQEKYIKIEDIFFIILFGIIFSPILTITIICNEFKRIKDNYFANPLYKESKDEQ